MELCLSTCIDQRTGAVDRVLVYFVLNPHQFPLPVTPLHWQPHASDFRPTQFTTSCYLEILIFYVHDREEQTKCLHLVANCEIDPMIGDKSLTAVRLKPTFFIACILPAEPRGHAERYLGISIKDQWLPVQIPPAHGTHHSELLAAWLSERDFPMNQPEYTS